MAPKWGPWLAERPSRIRSLRTHRHDQRFPKTQRDTKQSTHDMLREHHFHFALHKKFVKHRFHLWAGGWIGLDWIVVSLTPTEKGPFARKLMGAVGDGDRAIDVLRHQLDGILAGFPLAVAPRLLVVVRSGGRDRQ